MEIKELKKSRIVFLKNVYEKSNGDVSFDVDVREIQKALKLTDDDTWAIVHYLTGEKLITKEGSITADHILITSTGINLLEKSIGEENVLVKIEKHYLTNFLKVIIPILGTLVSIIIGVRSCKEKDLKNEIAQTVQVTSVNSLTDSLKTEVSNFKNELKTNPNKEKIYISSDESKINANKDDVYNFLDYYLSTRNDRNPDAHQFFADNVDQYYLVYDVNPDKIDGLDQANTEYIDMKSTIKKETLELVSKEGNICYWRFWSTFSCYRPLLRKYQTGRVHLEYGINNEQKITKIKQLEHTERYSNVKPY